MQAGYSSGFGIAPARTILLPPNTVREVVTIPVAAPPLPLVYQQPLYPPASMYREQYVYQREPMYHEEYFHQATPPRRYMADEFRSFSGRAAPSHEPMAGQHRRLSRAAPSPEPMAESSEEDDPIDFKVSGRKNAQRAGRPNDSDEEPEIIENIIEHEILVPKIIEVEVQREVERVVEREVQVERIVERVIEVPVEVTKEVPVEVPYEKVVTVERPVETVVYKDVPVPVQMSNERVVVREIPVPIEVVKEIPIPVERIVYHEVLTPMGANERAGGLSPGGHQASPMSARAMHETPQGSRVGLGLVLEQLDSEIILRDLVPGLAAWNSGQLHPGDVMVSVDGLSVDGYDLDQIKTLTVGNVGSSCQVQVRRDGKVVTALLCRVQG